MSSRPERTLFSSDRASPPAKPRTVPDWLWRGYWAVEEYLEVTVVIAAVTLVAWFIPIDYRIFGDIYLLTVIVLCLRVGRWPIFFAAVLSAVAWNFVIVPPRMSFSAIDLKDGLFLGTYFVVALIAGQLTARIRAQHRREREREQRATALYHLTQAMSAASSLDEGVEAALRQADAMLGARTALWLPDARGRLRPHPAGSLNLDAGCRAAAEAVWSGEERRGVERRRTVWVRELHLPLARVQERLGVFSIGWDRTVRLAPRRVELLEAYSVQIGLLVEREQLRSASAREKLLEESERLHRTLLDSVSHELRTPLAVLRTAAENITRAEGERRAVLGREMRTAIQRLDRLVANLLNQTRLESGALKPRPDWCDARDIIGAARRLAGESLTGCAIQVSVPPDMPLFLADAALMEHVLVNLLLNAAHHGPAGGPIAIEAGLVSDGGRVFIAVSDRGPGIAPERRATLFQKFQRGDNARAGGLGLGLSIVQGLMQAQGGAVEVSDNTGGGARFSLYLPHQVHETVPNE